MRIASRTKWTCLGCSGLLALLLLGAFFLLQPFVGFPMKHGLGFFADNAMRSAVNEGDLERVKELVNRKPRLVNCVYYGLKSETHRVFTDAIVEGHTEIAHFLLAHGADPNSRSAPYGTPLHAAVRTGNCQIVVSLVAHGAKIDSYPGIHSLIRVARERKDWKMCRLLRGLKAKDAGAAGTRHRN